MTWNYDLHKVQFPLNPRKYVVQVVSSPRSTHDESSLDNLQVKFYTNFNSHSIHVSLHFYFICKIEFSWFCFEFNSLFCEFILNRDLKSIFSLVSQMLVEKGQTQIESFFHVPLNFGIIHIAPHSPSVFHVRKGNYRQLIAHDFFA